MNISGWRRWIGRLSNSARSRGRSRSGRVSYRPQLEGLESRWQPSITSLTSANTGSEITNHAIIHAVSAAAAITSAPSATFLIGMPNRFTVGVTGSPAPTLSEKGALPRGVHFNARTGLLYGTPLAGTAGIYNLVFTANNGQGSPATQSFTLSVAQLPSITSVNHKTFQVGKVGKFTLKATGFPKPTWIESGALPAGISLNPVTGVLSGKPAEGTGGTYGITFTATNGVGSDATQNFVLTVNEDPVFTSASSMTFTVAVLGQSITVAATGMPKPTLRETGKLPSGITFNPKTGVLSGAPNPGTGGVYRITFTASNGIPSKATQVFTLTVNEAPAVISPANYAFVVGKVGQFTLKAAGFPKSVWSETGALPAGVTFNAAKGMLIGIPAAGTAGTYTVSFKASNGLNPDATQTFILTVQQAPVITSPNNATFVVGAAGSFSVTTRGFPAVSLSATGALPAGLTFDSTTGMLKGTPAPGTSGIYQLILIAKNGFGANAVQVFKLVVNQAPAITSANTATFHVGVTASFTLVATGFPAPTWSTTDTLPKGLTLNAKTGVLSGKPAAGTAKTYMITFKAKNGVGQDATQVFTLVIT